MRRLLIAFCVAALLAAGCTSSTPESTPTPDAAGTDSPPASPDTTPEASGDLELGYAGLGAVDFGDGADAAAAELIALLGEPDEDSGWTGSFSVYGTCPGQMIRALTWGPLRVLFTDGDTDLGEAGVRHFFAWEYGQTVGEGDPAGLTTPERIGIGSTVAEVKAAYGADTVFDEDPFGPHFSKGGRTPTAMLFGTMTSAADDGTVIYISYGTPSCGE